MWSMETNDFHSARETLKSINVSVEECLQPNEIAGSFLMRDLTDIQHYSKALDQYLVAY